MKTVEFLFQKYGEKIVKLNVVAADFYGITDIYTANRMAERKQFPGLHPFRARDSKRSPWLVDIENLADALDNSARLAKRGGF